MLGYDTSGYARQDLTSSDVLVTRFDTAIRAHIVSMSLTSMHVLLGGFPNLFTGQRSHGPRRDGIWAVSTNLFGTSLAVLVTRASKCSQFAEASHILLAIPSKMVV